MGSGFKVLVEGDTGTGKTYSLRTLCNIITGGVFLVATEPGAMEILGDIPCDKLHYHYVPAANPSFDALIDSGTKINQMTYEGLTKLSGIGKTEYAQFLDVLRTLKNFKCDRCGKEFGSVDKWDDTRALVIDSLSGLGLMTLDLTVGGKPVKHQGEWGVAMDNLERLINKLCFSTKCHFVMTAHIEREMDEVSGGVTLMVSAPGKKLSPKIPRYFDDVVHTRRENAEWFWTVLTPNVATKSRHLEYVAKLKPSFAPILEAYKRMNPAPETAPEPGKT